MIGPSGMFKPLVHYPPLYPLLLSVFGFFRIDLLSGARWLDILLFIGLILSLFISVLSLTRSVIPALSIAGLAAVSPVMLELYTGAMSDPLALTLGTGSLLSVLLYIERQRKHWLWLGAALSGMGLLTRYIGVAYVLTGILALLVLDAVPWKNRIKNCLIYAGVSACIMGIWLAWTYFQTNTLGNRSFSVVADLQKAERSLVGTYGEIFWSWLPFIPDRIEAIKLTKVITSVALLAMILSMQLIGLFLYRRSHKQPGSLPAGLRMAFLSDLFLLVYLTVLTGSVLFTLPGPDVNNRMLAPVLLSLFIAVIGSLFAILELQISGSQGVGLITKALFVIAAGMVVLDYLPKTLNLAETWHQDPVGYNHSTWRNSATIATVKRLPKNIPLISNNSAVLLFQTGRAAYDISELLNNQPQDPYLRYGDNGADEPQKIFREEGAALVIFNDIHYPMIVLYGNDAEVRLDSMVKDLYLYGRFSDGAIYFYSAPNFR
ncbi:MAG TPA: glycosyltransferase family 39 protein [Anaerolineaceae bacterium]|nr:glycosyltransferase family 39 protein [Anaerolineaceae bacterium]